MPFHFFGPPPPHILPIILSSALAFAAGAVLISRHRLPASVVAFGNMVRERVSSWTARADGTASHVFSRATGSTGNAAFDDYRATTLTRLEAEASEFRAYLDGLRRTHDQGEFENYLKGRRDGQDNPAQKTL